MRKPEFQKIGRIKAALFIRSAFGGPKFSGSWSVEYVTPSDGPVSLVFFVPITTGSTYNGTHKLVERDNSLPGAPLAVFAPISGAWCCFRLRLRLKGG